METVLLVQSYKLYPQNPHKELLWEESKLILTKYAFLVASQERMVVEDNIGEASLIPPHAHYSWAQAHFYKEGFNAVMFWFWLKWHSET